jgi:hypothetical protein
MLALESPTTEGPYVADMTPKLPPGVLSAAAVADVLTAERRKKDPEAPAYRANTILDYLRESQQTLRSSGRPRRYAKHPVPSPAGRMGLMPWWRKNQTKEWIDWYHQRPGRGHGRGGWPAGRARRKATT